jgi:SAM-dependent methyltransferase
LEYKKNRKLISVKNEVFYDNWVEKLKEDYLNSNPRLLNAIKIAIEKSPKKINRILDIGCGIGWSTYDLSRTFKSSFVVGVDVSEELIKQATSLFVNENLLFKKIKEDSHLSDIDETKFNYIVLIDVFEHIEQKNREIFLNNLKKYMDDECSIFLACPTIHHQNYLREHEKGGLQPVDENIEIEDFIFIAKKTETQVCFFENVGIWNTNDYQYCLLTKRPSYEPVSKNQKKIKYLEESQNKKNRIVTKKRIPKNVKKIFSNLKEFLYK